MKITRKLTLLSAAIVLGILIGVYRTTAPSNSLYYGLICAVTAFFAAIALLQGKRSAPLARPESTAFKTVVATSSIILFASAGYQLFILFTGVIDILLACVLALAVVSAYGMLYNAAAPKNIETAGVLSVVPVFFMSLFLLQMYKQYAASNPNIAGYATEIIAVVMMTLAIYAVSSMRFLDLSRSFIITFSVLTSTMMTCVILSSSLFTLGSYSYVLSLPEIVVLASMALYCGAWYLYPPVKYRASAALQAQAETRDDDNLIPSFFDDEKAEPIVPDLDAIIEEIKSSSDDPDDFMPL